MKLVLRTGTKSLSVKNISDINNLLFMLAIKVTVDNFATYCCSYFIVASIVISFKIMTQKCLVKRFKTEEKHAYKTVQ